MDNTYNNGLFGFLQKPSLFQNSPSTNPRRRSRSRSRSKDSRVSDKLSNIHAFDQRSIGSTSRIPPKPQNFNYQYANNPQNRPPQQKMFGQHHQPITKAVATSFAKNMNIQGQRQPMDNNINAYQPANNFINASQKFFPSDKSKNYPSNLPNPNVASSNVTHVTSSFGPNHNNHPSAFANTGHPNHNLSHGAFTVNQKVAKNADYNSTRFDPPTSPISGRGAFDARSDRFRPQEEQQSTYNRSMVQQNKVWTDLVTYSASFQAARLQSIQCLQSLSVRVSSQIANINVKIQSLNAKMATVLNHEFEQIRRRITEIIQTAYREKQKYIYDYMNKKQNEIAGEMLKVRETLLKESDNIQKMKERLKTSQWRQAAGQILSSEMEKKIEVVIQRSHDMQLAQWDIGDIGSSHIKHIEKQFRELISLKNK